MDLNKLIESSPAKLGWEKIGLQPRHGINTPIFSLKTENSSGIGEFLDLTLLIDWCKEIGFSIIQLLPLNDTGSDPSPYNALSAFALNPIYISLHALPFVNEIELLPFKKLNKLDKLDYAKVLSLKMIFLKNYFNIHFKALAEDLSFKAFVNTTEWLKPYALFKVLKHRYNQKSWQTWPIDLQHPSTSLLEELYEKEKESMNFYFFLQYFACKQLKWIKSYANQKQIFLKGDIPILISPDSIDVWLRRDDFNLEYTAGAPPDMFNPEGQNWGFPTYRWDVIEKTGFHFWKTRLNIASEFYDIFRLDHIIGFYRIWAIQKEKKATEGTFLPPDPHSALLQGEFLLKKLLSFTNMFPMGEDLGLFIDHIRRSLNQMAIPGTKIVRWERRYESDCSFIPYQDYPPFSLTTLSTHDTETLFDWWNHFPDDAKQLCKDTHLTYQKTLTPKLRSDLLQTSHQSTSLFHINLLGEYLSLIPEYVSNDMRINRPGTTLTSNWSLRYIPSLEKITNDSHLTKLMQSFL